MVPNGWTLKELQTIISSNIKNGFSPVASDDETGYWVLGLGALSDDGIKTDEIKPVEPTKKVIESLLSKGDFLVSRSNTPDKVGRSIQYRGEINNCSYPDLMMKFRVDEAQVYPLFVEQQLKSSVVRAYFKMCASGSSKSMVKINKKVLEKTPLLVPPLVEQQKIAKILSTWDKAISTTERLIKNSTQQKKALMQQLLTSKKRLLDDGGKRFEGAWRDATVSSFGKVVTGSTPPKNDSSNYNGNISWATAEDFKRKYVSNTKVKLTESGAAKARVVPKGSVLVTCIASIGKNAIANESLATNQQINSVVINKNNSNEFFYYLIEFNTHKLLAWAGTTAVPILNKTSFEKVKFIVPNLKEQQKIAIVLTNADKEIELLEQQLADLQQEKKALMQVLLTGKKRVVF